LNIEMEKPFDISGINHALNLLTSTLPSSLWSFYNDLRQNGFNEQQALTLTNTFLNNLLGMGQKGLDND